MIKLLRVDHRLLHGQVAMAWTQSLDSDCILIANDAVVNDNIRKTTMKLAKPNGVKLVMKNIEDSIAALNAGVTDKYKLFIVVESIEDAYRLAKGYAGIRSINLGGCKPKEDIVKTIYKTIPVTARDEEMLKELLNDGIEIEIRQVPGESIREHVRRKIMLVQAILIGLIAMFVTFEWMFGTNLGSRPIITGMLVGLVMGDLKTGIILGATLEMVFIGSITLGAAVPPDVITGGILGAAFAISTGKGADVALALAFPIATLYLVVDNVLTLGILPFFLHKADNYIEKGDFKGMERMHILGGFVVKSLPRGIICAVAFYLGTPVMNRVLEAIPVFVQNGLVAAAGFIPALGIALLAQMILSKKTMVYFILGFALAAYLKIPMLGIAMMAGCLAVILVQMQGTQKVAVQEVEDDDF